MTPTFRRAALALISLAVVGASARLQAQDTRTTVAVFDFSNGSIGKDRADYETIGKGIADLLLNDLATRGAVRVVDRSRIQDILREQDLAQAGRIDPQTAAKVGRILGMKYVITGGFMSDGRGQMVLTSYVINTETTQIMNPQKVQAKTDDVLGVIAQLSQKIVSDLKLPALSAAAVQAGEAQVAQAEAAKPAPKADAPAEAKVADKPAARTEKAEKADKPAEKRVAQASKPAGKLDLRTALLYSKALDAEDRGNKKEAIELYKAVVAKFPDMPAAKQKLARLGA